MTALPRFIRWVPAFLILSAAALSAAPRLHAITVSTGPDGLFPTTAEIIMADPSLGLFRSTAAGTREQTFQVTSSFDLWRLYFVSSVSDLNSMAGQMVDFTIYQIPDTLATPIPTVPDPADIVLASSFTFPTVVEGRVLEVIFDEPLSLAASPAPAGYALQLSGDDLAWWWRTGASGGNPYPLGAAYVNGVQVSPLRDYTLALSSAEPPPPPEDIVSVTSGDLIAGSTWSDGMPPHGTNHYHVLEGHTVTASGTTFGGGALFLREGGTLDVAVSGLHLPQLTVESGANVIKSVSGDFALGDINAPFLGVLDLHQDLSFTIDAGASFFLDMTLFGPGDLEFDAGAGAQLWLTATAGHEGTIRFNGAGDRVMITESQSIATLEMNSTGANTLFFDPLVQTGGGTVIFNEPGTIDHAATTTSPLRRLHGVGMLVANAPVTVDLSKGFPDDFTQVEERRFLVGGIHGDANITVIGTPVDFSDGAGITLNEFEVGGTPEPTTLGTSPYAGTITAEDFVNLEIRQHFPNARFVINNNAHLEMGNQVIAATHSVQMGEVVVNAGGILEVGFEQQSSDGVPGHHAYRLTLTASGTRDGSLTLNPGATLRMQVNGTDLQEFDSIVAHGDVQVGGTLEVLVNPDASSGASATAPNPKWTPTVGDTFDIIQIVPISPPGDYDGDGTVGPEDYDVWQANFGTGTFDAAAYTLWRDNLGQVGGLVGAITGTFDSVTVTDFDGAMAGFAFQVNYSPTAVQLEVVAAGAGASVVPEPSSLALGSLLLALLIPASRGRRRGKPFSRELVVL